MVKKMVKLPSTQKLLTLENVIGLLLAILIIFDLKVEAPICKLINTTMGKLFSLVVIILLLVFVHPIVAILFFIYLYQCLMNNSNHSENTKLNILQNLNPPKVVQVEEEVILNKAPIKNQNQNNNVEFNDYVNNVGCPI
jgi:predicted membrane protein